MNKIRKILTLGSILAPSVASAQQLNQTGQLILRIGSLVRNLTIVVAGIALLAFFWGLVKFISKAGDEKAHEEGRRIMIWGLVALFVMISVWGIIRFFQSELLPGGNYTPPPQVPALGGNLNII